MKKEMFEVPLWTIEVNEKIECTYSKNCGSNKTTGYWIVFTEHLGGGCESIHGVEAKRLKDIPKIIKKETRIPTWKSKLRNKLTNFINRRLR